MKTIGSSVTHFGVLRHAATEWNLARRIQGQSDSPLTPDGENQALGWGRLLAACSWSRILASDLGRARQTATLINRSLHLPLLLSSGLCEMDWGRWTGKTLAAIQQDEALLWKQQVSAEWNFRPPGGESHETVWRRAFQALAEASDRWPGDNILVVAHEGVIKSLMYHESTVSAIPKTGLNPRLCCLHRFTLMGGVLTVARTNAIDLNPPQEASI